MNSPPQTVAPNFNFLTPAAPVQGQSTELDSMGGDSISLRDFSTFLGTDITILSNDTASDTQTQESSQPSLQNFMDSAPPFSHSLQQDQSLCDESLNQNFNVDFTSLFTMDDSYSI